MAVKRYILTHRNDSGVVDTVHFQTDSDSVLRPDDSTVEAALSALKTDVQKAQQTADTAAGTAGIPGKDGENGKDAYEVAVDNGFTGTRTEWLLSLKGDKGDPGEAGATGATGPAGPGHATGGTTGQVAIKVDDTDYNTIWKTLGVSDIANALSAVHPTFTGSMLNAASKNNGPDDSVNFVVGIKCEAMPGASNVHCEGAYTYACNSTGDHAEGFSTLAIGTSGGFILPTTLSNTGGTTITLDKLSSNDKNRLDAALSESSSLDIYLFSDKSMYRTYVKNSIISYTENTDNATLTLENSLPTTDFNCKFIYIPILMDARYTDAYSASHAEGVLTAALVGSHAEGRSTTSIGSSHAEGNGCIAKSASHAEGTNTKATGSSSHSEGSNSTASGNNSHAEGNDTNATGRYSHAEGLRTTASGQSSHASGGEYTTASGDMSFAHGRAAQATGKCSFALGDAVKARADYQMSIGRLPNESSDVNDRFIVGGGTTSNSTNSTCFRVTTTGVYASGTYNASGADYAEQFEWADNNPSNEDRIGRFVTLDGTKIQFAISIDDFILGITSGNPSIIGDSYDDQWQGMYETDIYGRFIWEDVTIPAEYDEEGNLVSEEHIESQLKINPNYNPSEAYIPRSKRPEWATVGMMGKLVLIDDGTCEVNGWAKPTTGGIGTKSDTQTKFRVMERLDDTHVRVLIL